mgnify:CR=1 FL=1
MAGNDGHKDRSLPLSRAGIQRIQQLGREAFRLLTLFLKPVLPRTAENVETFLNCGELTWNSVDNALSSDKPINPFKHLMKRVDEKQVQQLFELSSKAAKAASEPAKEEKKA